MELSQVAAAAPVIAVEPTTSELRETTNRLTGLGNALSAAAEQRAVSRRRKSQRLSVCISRRGRWGAGQLLRLDPASPSISLDSTVVGVVGGAHTSFSDIQPGWLSIGRCSDSALAGRRCTVLPTPTIPRVCVGGLGRWRDACTAARHPSSHAHSISVIVDCWSTLLVSRACITPPCRLAAEARSRDLAAALAEERERSGALSSELEAARAEMAVRGITCTNKRPPPPRPLPPTGSLPRRLLAVVPSSSNTESSSGR